MSLISFVLSNTFEYQKLGFALSHGEQVEPTFTTSLMANRYPRQYPLRSESLAH